MVSTFLSVLAFANRGHQEKGSTDATCDSLRDVGCCKWHLSDANVLAGEEGDKLAGDSKIKTGREEPGSAMCKLIVSTSFQERYFFARVWPYENPVSCNFQGSRFIN